MERPSFTISLDLELNWGVRDVYSIAQYGENILGGREAVPKILSLFQVHGIHATWATVGFVTFRSRREMMLYLPEERPKYRNSLLDPYPHLSTIGKDEADDPYHFGYSLIQKIQDVPGMEIGSHSFSHFYCLEEQSNPLAFRADLMASVKALERLGIEPRALVFCRNQYADTHLIEAKDCGFKIFRGNDNEDSAFFSSLSTSRNPLKKRACRLLDTYLDLTGDNRSQVMIDPSGLVNVPSSRFLRPYSPRLCFFESMRLHRILTAMTHCAQAGSGFHLWWHPENFGRRLVENLFFLERILVHFRDLQAKYGMESLNFGEIIKSMERQKAGIKS